MKNLIISIICTLFTLCLYGQFNYSVGMGPQYNFSKIGSEEFFENKNNFTYFGKGEIYYNKSKMTFHFSAQWNRTKFIQKSIGLGSGRIEELKIRTDYISFNPNIGFKPNRFIEVNAGGFFALNMADASFEPISNSWVTASSSFNLTSPTDYGLTFGINGYIAQNISIELKHRLGIKNLRDDSIQFTDNDGNLIGGNSLKNRNLQLSFNYHFNDF